MRPGFDTIELHLIRVLHTVIHERSVSRAAVRLASTQPAVSAQLRRLRQLIGDPLLVRAGQQMQPTAVALQLLGPAERMLQDAEQLFGPQGRSQRGAPFEPGRAEGLFRLAASDYLDPLFLPRLVARLKRAAPGMHLELIPLTQDYDYRRHLAAGDVDLVIGNWLEPPEELHLSRLVSDEIVCLVAAGHPQAGGRGWTRERYLEQEHVAPMPMSPGAVGVIDEHLRNEGAQRRIVVRASHFSLIPLMVADSLLVLTTGRLFCSRYVGSLPVKIVRCPVGFPPLSYYQLWHELTHATPAQRWLREQVRAVAGGLDEADAMKPATLPQAVRAIRADLLDFTGTPSWADASDDPGGCVRFRPDHWLLIGADGRITGVQAHEPGPGVERHDHRGRLLLPGFVDSHVHSPQVPVMASYGTELLDWLNNYTFPSETAWADAEHATRGTERFLDALLAHGTTTAAVYPTVHKASAEALFAGAQARGMRIVGGKVLMDRHAPAGLRDTVEQAERDSIDLIQRWHGRGRCSYALTVRFAPTSTPEQLAMAGALARADPTLYMQTHVAENRDEVRWVAELFPQARSYLAVYDDAGLLHPRSVLAHGIWLDADDRARLAASGAHVAHCPTSNLFLGSGLYAWRAALAAGHATSLASDVGGGTSLSLLRNAAAAYTVQALQGERLTAWVALHAATRGGAEALHLGHEVGTLEPGLMADVAIWDWSAGTLDAERQRVARGLHERVFAWMTLADERHLAATWVAGQERYRRSNPT